MQRNNNKSKTTTMTMATTEIAQFVEINGRVALVG